MKARRLALGAAILAAALSGVGAGASAAPPANVTVSVPDSTGQPPNDCPCLRGPVQISATATPDTGRTISRVDFQRATAGGSGWTPLGSDTTPPYSLVVNTAALSQGTFDVRAVATDSAGESAASPVKRDVVFAGQGATYVALADPGAFVRGTIALRATVDPGGAPASQVTFERSPAGAETWTTIAEVNTDPAAPSNVFTATLDTTTVADGPYDFRVQAVSPFGEYVSGPRRNRAVDNAGPESALAVPAGTLSGEVTLTATAADAGAGVGAVRFERAVVGSDTWTAIGTRTRAPYEQRFDTRILEDGRYDLRVVATDALGNAKPSERIRGVEVSNPGRTRPDALSIENIVAPANSIRMLGAIAGSAQHEAWAIGRSSAAPAAVNGARLPYTAPGDQIVLLRYTDGDGWQIADVLREADGAAPFAQGARAFVTGQMLPSGETWIALIQEPSGGPVEGAIFHRAPGGTFARDAAASLALRPLLLNIDSIANGSLKLRLGQTGGGQPFGLLLAPSQSTRAVTVPRPSGPVTVSARLDYGVLNGAAWTRRTAELPADHTPRANESVKLNAADPTGAGSGWAAVQLGSGKGRLRLARFDESGWRYVTTGLDALDLTGAMDDSSLLATANDLRDDSGSGVWIDASVARGSGGARVVARYDTATGDVTRSWCKPLPRLSVGCGAPFDPDHPAEFPDRVFDTPAGKVALAVGHAEANAIYVYAHGDWTRTAAPGYGGGNASALFTAPGEGWLAGGAALGRVTTKPTPDPLTTWPQANRSALLGVALPPGRRAGVDAEGALAVGLDGTALRYTAAAGWLVTPTPSRARRLPLRSVAFNGASSAIAVGDAGIILRWDGSTWTEDPQSLELTNFALSSVAFRPDGQGWAVGNTGTILHYDGTRWTEERPPGDEEGRDLTAVAVAGDEVFAISGGNLITRTADGWRYADDALLPAGRTAKTGDLRVLAGLADGGLVAGGRSVLLVRQRAGEALGYSTQPIEGVAVAAEAFRDDGEVRAFVSLAPSVTEGGTGFPPGDGNLVVQTKTGWRDLSRAQYAKGQFGASAPVDGVVKTDPVLGIATDPSGAHAWVVGGYAGTQSTAGFGAGNILAGRPMGWRTAHVWRYDEGGSTPSPAVRPAALDLPARPSTVSFAFFSNATCREVCAKTRDAQPDVNLKGAMTQVARFAAQPGGPAFAMAGGNLRGPAGTVPPARFDFAAFDFPKLPALLAPLGDLPVFAALGQLDPVPVRDDALQPWADAFARSPEPFGSGTPPSNVTPVSSGAPTGGVHRYYSFEATQNGTRLRVIVLDNHAGSLEASAPGQGAWLEQQLPAGPGSGPATVVVVGRPLGTTPDEDVRNQDAELGRRLEETGVLAVFAAGDRNEWRLLPATQLRQYLGASLGYQRTENNGVIWYLVNVDAAARTVEVQGIPLVDSLALKPLIGLDVARSSTLAFEAIARRPQGTLATLAAEPAFPGFDNYATIPAADCTSCVPPAYAFSSSDPTIGDFVAPSGPNSRFPKLDASGRPTPSPASGLFCAYNSGTTNVSVTSGLLTSSLPVTVQPGDIGRPCGTVFRAGVGRVVIVPRERTVRQTTGTGPTSVPPQQSPPTEAPVESALPPIRLPPAPAPASSSAPEPPRAEPKPRVPPRITPPAVDLPPPPPDVPVFPPPPVAQVVALPLLPPVVQVVPPGGSASAQAAARRKEKARQHAKQSAYVTRPAGVTGEDWFYPAVGVVGVLSMLLIAGGMRPGPRARPAYLIAREPRRTSTWQS